jgi:flagellar biosynthesis protein FliR
MISAAQVQALGNYAEIIVILTTRFASTLGFVLVFRRGIVPSRVLLALSVTLAFFSLCMHNNLNFNSVANVTGLTLYGVLAVQFFLGLVLAIIVNIFIEIFMSFAQILSVQSGLGFLNVVVPSLGTITALTSLFVMVATVLFLELNGHLALISVLLESFDLHIGQTVDINIYLMQDIINFAGTIFSKGLLLALPVIIALLVGNLTIAFMSKFAPQINIMSIGINITLIICFLLLYFVFDGLFEQGNLILKDVISYMRFISAKIIHYGR